MGIERKYMEGGHKGIAEYGSELVSNVGTKLCVCGERTHYYMVNSKHDYARVDNTSHRPKTNRWHS